jgi:ketosteroid isomerase-like protein
MMLTPSLVSSLCGAEEDMLEEYPECFAATAAREAPMKRLAVVLFLFSLLATSSLAQDTPLAGSGLLLKLEADFARAVAEHGHDAFLTYFADDGVEIDSGSIATKDDLRRQGGWPPGASLTWTPVKAEMAASGDFGYTYGNYVFTAMNKDGNLVTENGKYTTIWKKQKDGSWRVILDMGNSSPAPPPKN